MAQLRDKSGKFVRTKPDYKALWQEAESNLHALDVKYMDALERMQKQERHYEWQLTAIKKMYDDAVDHMGWLRRLIFGFRAV